MKPKLSKQKQNKTKKTKQDVQLTLLQLSVTCTSHRRGFRRVSSATSLTSPQLSTSAYRLLVGFAGSKTYGPCRSLKCKRVIPYLFD